MAAQAIAEVAQKILQGGFGFAIPASVEVIKSGHGTCPLNQAKAFVVTEEGTGSCYIYPYKNTQTASDASSSWFSCHIVYDMKGNEVRAGGVGFAQHTCRKNGLNWLHAFLKK
jgi:hypothetical protein